MVYSTLKVVNQIIFSKFLYSEQNSLRKKVNKIKWKFIDTETKNQVEVKGKSLQVYQQTKNSM